MTSKKPSKSAGKPATKKKATKGKPPALSFSENWELKLGHPGVIIAGVDEVGRGCLAGPVVAAAVVPPTDIDYKRDPWLREVNDSKELSAETRERLAPLIRAWAQAFSVAESSVEEIDRINIYHASHLAMVRATEALSVRVQHVLVDGNHTPKQLKCSATALVKGDGRVLSIACASILAKVYRDSMMADFDSRYPGYGFAGHKGYSTPVHSRALKEIGACEIHRRSFAPVAEALGRKPPALDAETLFLFDEKQIHE